MYDLVAYIARYGFCGLMLVILWRAVHWIRHEASVKAIQKSMLPDAGFIGEWAVLHGDQKLPDRTILNAPGDGFLGSGRSCDVRIPVKGVKKRVARFYFRPDGLHLLPVGGAEVVVDGRLVRQEAVLRHGAILSVKGVVLQFRLFAGILLIGEAVAGPVKNGKDALDEGLPYEDFESYDAYGYSGYSSFSRDSRESSEEPVPYEQDPDEEFEFPVSYGSFAEQAATVLPTPALRRRLRGKRGGKRERTSGF